MSPRWRSTAIAVLALLWSCLSARAQFRVPPYLQNPSPHEVTILWFTVAAVPGAVRVRPEGTEKIVFEAGSAPQAAPELSYTDWEIETFFNGAAPPALHRHEVRVTGLQPGGRYRCEVRQGDAAFRGLLHAAPSCPQPGWPASLPEPVAWSGM